MVLSSTQASVASPGLTEYDSPDSPTEPFELFPFSRMPGLAAPFALVGASATFFCIQALAVCCWGIEFLPPLVPSAFGALVGAIMGFVFRRWRRLHDPFSGRDSRVFRIAFVMLLGGASVGAFVAKGWG